MKKLLTVLTFPLVFFILLSSCSADNKPTSNLKTVQLSEVVRSIFYAPMYAAISEGFFEEEGIKIELTTAQGADSLYTKTQYSQKIYPRK